MQMDVPSTQQVAIVGLGLAGCGVVTILKESFSGMPSAPAYLMAVDDKEEALNVAKADKKIMARPGEKLDMDFSRYAVVFFVLEPSGASALTWAQVLASKASEKKAYTFELLIKANIPVEGDQYPFALLSMIDISQHKRQEHTLTEERNLMRFMLDNIPDQVFLKDSDIHAFTALGVCLPRAGAASRSRWKPEFFEARN